MWEPAYRKRGTPLAIMLVSLKYSVIIHIHCIIIHHHHTLHYHCIIIACIIYAWIYWFILQEPVFKPGYIIQIFNSQHGWIFIMVINNQYYDWGFQSRFSAMDIIYSTMEGIVPSRCRLTTRHLGATLFKLRLHQICMSHVTASMHHDTWGLMQGHFLLALLKIRLITL